MMSVTKMTASVNYHMDVVMAMNSVTMNMVMFVMMAAQRDRVTMVMNCVSKMSFAHKI